MISVIVPVYNVEKYLKPCLDSILNSTYQDIELIPVDDGSTDNSGAICDEYARKDARVHVIHKANGGVSSARNEGLRVAGGEFVSFIDGDDVIHPEMMEILVNAFDEGDYDFSMCYMRRVDEGKSIDMSPSLFMASDVKPRSRQDYVQGLYSKSFQELTQYTVTCNKLFTRELIHGVSFSALRSGEDTEWMHRVCHRTRNWALVEKELYFYIQHGSSVTHVAMNPVYFDRIRSYQECLNHIPREDAGFRSMCLQQLYKTMIVTRYNSVNTPYLNEAVLLNDKVYKSTIKEFKTSQLSWTTKLKLLTFYHCPWSYHLFIKGCDIVARLVR